MWLQEHAKLVVGQIRCQELVFAYVMLGFILIHTSMNVSLAQTLTQVVQNVFMMQPPTWVIAQFAREQEMLQTQPLK